MERAGIVSVARLITVARQHRPLADLPAELVPKDEAEAYAIQDAILPAEQIIGWKVGPAGSSNGYRCAPIAVTARIENGGAITAGSTTPEIEAEVALVLGADLAPVSGNGDRAAVLSAIRGACLAIEVVGSCFADRNAVSDLSTLADFQSNRGLVVGKVTADWQARDLKHLRPLLTAEEEAATTADKPMPSTEAVLDAVLWLAGHAAARGRPLRSGQIIITGARVGPVAIHPGQTFTASAGGYESVAVRR